ncbi:VCBS repeat-containing protein [Chryseolinea sp. T2]|uniref:VCBS repeat-containing protein n=1 Tax=Chryseolinea sp. T2 TaxID=3129255 RepID=UPI003076B20C
MTRVIMGLFVLAILVNCGDTNKKRFTIHYGGALGIDFQNTIITTDSFNALTYEYIYNGSGVGVGDFNNDGLEDLFFGGNQVSSRLYLNEGKLKFRDVSKQAGITTDRWVTGVSVIDINQDGLLDVFLAVAGRAGVDNTRDLLFVNKGIKDGVPEFVESARSFGLDDDGYGTMGAFLDYDKDGDPDLYLVTNALESFNRNNLRPKRINGEASSTDRLYRNNGDGTFINISRDAGILIEGYGLGVGICDLNNDSWPDVYVANDFMSNDLIWINQHNGTFKNMAADYLSHQTHNGMGVDIADFNNDARSDIIVVDMLPPGHKRMKMMTPGQNYDHFHMAMDMGYQPQYMRNTLQMNRGMFSDSTIRFSEVAFEAGISSTDWSWAPLLIDLDNDGRKDLFIANGYRKDVTDLDFIFFGLKGASPFGTAERRQSHFNAELEKLPEVKLNNYVFRNKGRLAFDDVTKEWGTDLPTFSNGAAYADFDNDGDVDLVTNNIDQEVILYENNTTAKYKDAEHKYAGAHYLKLKSLDTAEWNQKIRIYTHDSVQYFEVTPYRGFQSSVSPIVHAGLGGVEKVDSISIIWIDGKELVLRDVPADTLITFSKRDAMAKNDGLSKGDDRLNSNAKVENVSSARRSAIWFEQVKLLAYTHEEKSPSDIKLTRTLLHELSQSGPCVAVGDVNGDKFDDLFIGGEKGVAGKLFLYSPGGFKQTPLPIDSSREDGAAVMFDADNDGDVDLYVASSCASSQDDPAPHQLFINNGSGKFAKAMNLPLITTSSECVIAADYDIDGDTDLFVAGSLSPRKYPESPRSILLRNDGGVFSDVTDAIGADLAQAGMISDAVWIDVNGDKKTDLVTAGEWAPISVFINDGSRFLNKTSGFGLDSSNGWWNCLRIGDFNSDGFPDLLAGNTGTNSFFHPSREYPVTIVAKDFDGNGSVDPIINYYNPVEQDRFILHNRLVLIDQVPGFKRRFETFGKYATTSFANAFREEELAGVEPRYAYTLSTCVLMNDGGKKFRMQPLPEEAQLSTVNDFLISELNNDGHSDVIAVGNSYNQETLFGRYDASLGTIMFGDGKGNWRIVDNSNTNFKADGAVNAIRLLQGKETYIALIRNDGPVTMYRLVNDDEKRKEQGPALTGNPTLNPN